MIINRELFEAWLFSQDREREFDFNSCKVCLLGCFLQEQLGLRFFTVLEGELCYNGANYEHPDWFFKLTEKWVCEPSKKPKYTKFHSFGEAQDSYLQLFPNTLDSNQSQTEAPSAPVAKELGTSLNQVVSSQKCD